MRSDEELLNSIGAMNAGSNAPTFEKAKAELFLKCTKNIVESIAELNNSIKQNSVSNENVARKIFWLNTILTAATAVGAMGTVFLAYNS